MAERKKRSVPKAVDVPLPQTKIHKGPSGEERILHRMDLQIYMTLEEAKTFNENLSNLLKLMRDNKGLDWEAILALVGGDGQ